MASAGNKRYQQPYSSAHVIHNTVDSIRADEPTYIRVFPRFLYSLNKKQTPFHINILNHTVPLIRQQQQTADRSSSRKSLTPPPPHEAQNSAPPSPTQNQQAGFKTLGPRGGKSPNMISSMPSDFEHIFHYSETNQ